jgi:phytoene synthase
VSVALKGGASDFAAWQTLRHHGKSFAWAARLMPARDAGLLARLYAVCRTIDDLADQDCGPEVRARLVALRSHPWHPLSDDPIARDLATLVTDASIKTATMHQLIDGVLGDLGTVAVRDEAGLIRYAYHVAGTVGLMVCDVLQVHAPPARLAAVNLGIAMQLTNIARDVMEDAHAGRRYLPATWLDASPDQIAAALPKTRAAAAAAVLRLLDLADRHYWAATAGYRFLPLSSRLGMVAAARIYQGIGTELRRRRGDYARGRVFVPGWRKMLLTFCAAGQLAVRARAACDLPSHGAIRDLLPPGLRTGKMIHAPR